MNSNDIIMYLPPLRQKITVLVLAVLAVLWLVHISRKHHLREEHALLWFLGIGIGVVVVWWDKFLVIFTSILGIKLPSSALILFATFFLMLMTVWLTTVVSRQKQQIIKLIMMVSILKNRLDEHEKSEL